MPGGALVNAAREQAGVELQLELLLLVGATLAARGQRLLERDRVPAARRARPRAPSVISPCQAARDQPSQSAAYQRGHAEA